MVGLIHGTMSPGETQNQMVTQKLVQLVTTTTTTKAAATCWTHMRSANPSNSRPAYYNLYMDIANAQVHLQAPRDSCAPFSSGRPPARRPPRIRLVGRRAVAACIFFVSPGPDLNRGAAGPGARIKPTNLNGGQKKEDTKGGGQK